MGLDMYLYRISNPKGLPASGYITPEQADALEKKDIRFFHDDALPVMCKTMRDMLVKVVSDEEVWDLTQIAMKLCAENKLTYTPEMEDDIHCTCISSRYGTRFNYKQYSTILSEESERSYIIHKRSDLYAIKMQNVAYQRKGLNNRGWELMACENCGYTDDYDRVRSMVEEGGLDKSFLLKWKDNQTVFHPWW